MPKESEHKDRCGNCFYARTESLREGHITTCHRQSPEVASRPVWPYTDDNGWCGEYWWNKDAEMSARENRSYAEQRIKESADN